MFGNRSYKIGDFFNEWEIINIEKNTDEKSKNNMYVCRGPCGHLKKGISSSFRQTKFCPQCPRQRRKTRRPKPSKKIGEYIENFEIVGYDTSQKTSKYKVKCSCGKILCNTHYQLKKRKICYLCSLKKRTSFHIGKILGNFTVIGQQQNETRTKLNVICNICKKQYFKSYCELGKSKWCPNCIGGYYPGLRIKNITLLERLGNCLWKAKCDCGNFLKKSIAHITTQKYVCICQKKINILDKAKQKIGLKYYNLKIVDIASYENGHITFLLKCSCGTTLLRNNGNEFKSKSCGCKWHANAANGENCTFSKLNEIEVLSIRELYQSTLYSIDELSKMFDITKGGIEKILNRQTWKHLK